MIPMIGMPLLSDPFVAIMSSSGRNSADPRDEITSMGLTVFGQMPSTGCIIAVVYLRHISISISKRSNGDSKIGIKIR